MERIFASVNATRVLGTFLEQAGDGRSVASGERGMNPTPDIQRILVPHDFNEPANRALAYAIALAQRFDAQVTVLHVYECPSYGFPEAMVASYEFEAEVKRQSLIALDDVTARADAGKVAIDTLLRRGTPWVEIGTAAESIKADLIVMGTQGRHGVARALLGSVAERVVRTASVPVLTVHANDRQQPALSATPAAERIDHVEVF